MFVTGVVHYQVHQQLNASCMQANEQCIEVGNSAKCGRNSFIITYIVPIIIVGRSINGIEPYQAYAQALNIIQFGDQSGQVADPIAITVFETAGVDLVNDGFFPPFFIFYLHA